MGSTIIPITNAHSHGSSRFQENYYFSRIKEIALGILFFVGEFFLLIKLSPFIENISNNLKKINIKIDKNKQDAINLLEATNKCNSTIFRTFLKVVLVGYITILGPIIEEYLFRNRLYKWIRDKQPSPDSLISKISRIFINAICFGLCHFSPFQGWTNISIIMLTTFLGIVLSTLRELTPNIVASSTCHILHNAFSTILIFNNAF